MKKIRLAMIDDNIELIGAVKEYLKDNEQIELLYEAYDGIYVLEEMKSKGIGKDIIVATSYNAMDTIRQVSEYGVNYYVLKPFDLEDLEKKILLLSNKSFENKS